MGSKMLALTDEVQKVALSEVTYVPWGEWVQPTAFSRFTESGRKPARNPAAQQSPGVLSCVLGGAEQ